MSEKISNIAQHRPYKIEIYGLQDDYIGTLQSYNDSFLGRIKEPKITISEDGSQSFSCQVPKFYIDPETNFKIDNPRWQDVITGILAKNTRILKAFVSIEGKVKVYPFIIDEIIDTRDEHYATYKEIKANGLAFSELGKVGYKLELTEAIINSDLEKDSNTVATIDYWLDKVFPNVKNGNGEIIEWLTPWCYEIRMDWKNYLDAVERENTKIYDDAYTSSWTIDKYNNFISQEITSSREKARIINCVNSNKYNITQTLAETYEVFCNYEYTCTANGQFMGSYIDECGHTWTGRKVVFYNRAIKTEAPIYVEYQKNLNTISRTCDSSEIYSKLYVTPLESAAMTNGYITIADAQANPTMEDYFLNFEYLYEQGGINDFQKDLIADYEKAMHRINSSLKEVNAEIDDLVTEINEIEAEVAFYEKEIAAAQEELTFYKRMRDNEATNTPVQKNVSNSFSIVFTVDNTIIKADLRLEGITAATIQGYKTYKYSEDELLFSASDFIKVNSIMPLAADDQNFYLLVDEYDFPSAIYTSVGNKQLNLPTGGIVYLALQYLPKNKYIAICNQFTNAMSLGEIRKKVFEELLVSQQQKLEVKKQAQELLLQDKDKWYQKLEKLLGPALREGYWTPEQPDSAFEKEEVTFSTIASEINSNTQLAQLIWDEIPFASEENGSYAILTEQNAVLGISRLGHLIFPVTDNSGSVKIENRNYGFINIEKEISNIWQNYDLTKIVLHLQDPFFTYNRTETNNISDGQYYLVYNGIRYYFTLTAQPQQMIIETEIAGAEGFVILLKVTYTNGTNEIIRLFTADQLDYPQATNLTSVFENITSFLGDYTIYPDAGFTFSFKRNENGTISPILLLNNSELPYKNYAKIGWSLGEAAEVAGYFNSEDIVLAPEKLNIVYPRIVILTDNVNYDSDLLMIKKMDQNGQWTPLTKFYDYSVLLRKGHPYFTLKCSTANTVQDILNGEYRIIYQVSHANDLLYLQAKQVAKDNSRPRYSYEITLAHTPNNLQQIELGQLVYINDYLLGVHAATGYVNEITLDLDSPQNDEIKIQNYKTKFEDLFSTITASAEAMKQSKLSYDLAANNFECGALSPNTLQTAINNADLSMNFSNTKVSIDDVSGILLTNEKAYSNGVFGQVALQGGGIYLSSAIDPSTQERIWSTAITPKGINASLITAGQIDTSVIRVFAGNEMAFQWNSEGIFAYKNEKGIIDPNIYVKYSQHGLEYKDNETIMLSLDWNGLIMRNKAGDTTFQMDKETGNLTMSGIINARGGTIGGLEINPDSLGSGTGVLIGANSVKITADHNNSIYLNSAGIELKTAIEDSTTLIKMDKEGILLQAAQGQEQNSLALTKDAITFGAEQKVTISADGLSGERASFASLTVGGKPVLGNYAEIVISSNPPTGKNILWFKTTPVGRIATSFGSWSTGGSRHHRIGTTETAWCENGEHDGAERITIGKMTPLDTNETVNYTLSFPVYYWLNEASNSKFNTEITAKLSLGEQEIIFNPVSISIGKWEQIVYTATATGPNLITQDNVGANKELTLLCKGTHYHSNFTINSHGAITLSVVNPNANSESEITEYTCEVRYIE